MQEASFLARVLVVDDEQAQMTALCNTLRDHGYETTGFTTGLDALDALKEQNFDLLLADLMMPEIGGIALMQAALQMDAHLVCIIMTGNGTIGTAVEAMRMGALDYILKPFKLSVILPVLSRALAVRLLRQENAMLERRVQERTMELEVANAELERARRSKDRFMATVSHELRSPLNSILGFTDVLLMNTPGNALTADQKDMLNIVLTSGKHLLSLINDLLDLARIEAGKVELSPQPVNCQVLVKDVVASLQIIALRKGLAIESRQPATPLVLYTDRRALFQIVMNLVNNAIKYTTEGAVLVELGQYEADHGTTTQFRVTDPGVGIRTEDQAKLFDAFAQVGDTHNHKESTGLGLYLSAELARLLGGHITLKSEFGIGSTFTLVLPASKAMQGV